MTLGFVTWDVSPVALSIFGHEIRWYGLLWALGFYVGYRMVSKRFAMEKLPHDWVDQLLLYTIISAVIGARLGHCLFYEWDYYKQHLLEIVMIWKGGLASHGGALALILALIWYSRKITHKSVWWLFDRMIPAIAIACAMIRLGNLMNSEVFGYPTTMPWGFYFVRSYEWQEHYYGQPCHPTQIYEMLYCIAAALWGWIAAKKGLLARQGLITGVALIIFFLSRFLLEFLKLPQVEHELSMTLDIGQWLSIPLILLGIYLIIRSYTLQKPHK